MACHEILREDLGKRKLNADSSKSKRRIVLQFVPTFWKLQAKKDTFCSSIITGYETWCLQ
jgi:hypothetical protein